MDSFLKDYLFANQFWVIYFGALVGHFFSLNKIDFKGTLPFFKRLIPDKKEQFYHIVDFIISPLLGSIVVFLFLSPDNIKMSLYTGITWSTILMFISELKKEEIR